MHSREQERCGRKRIRQRGTLDLDKADDMGLHRRIVAAVAVAVGIAGSRGCSSWNTKRGWLPGLSSARRSGTYYLLPVIFSHDPGNSGSVQFT